MQLKYQYRGMECVFTLMTIGDYRGASATPAPTTTERAIAETTESGVGDRVSKGPSRAPHPAKSMPPPSQPVSRSFNREPPSQRTQRPSPPPPRPSLDPESLFLPVDEDEDRQWGERNYDEEEDTVGWSASAVKVSKLPTSQSAVADQNI